MIRERSDHKQHYLKTYAGTCRSAEQRSAPAPCGQQDGVMPTSGVRDTGDRARTGHLVPQRAVSVQRRGWGRRALSAVQHGCFT